MTVGVLIIAHDTVGQSLLDTAVAVIGVCPIMTEVLAVNKHSNPERTLREAYEKLARLDEGDGVLVLTDIYGSTPSNIACKLKKAHHIEVVAGMNLPMLVRILNYHTLSLSQLVDKAITGGHDGIVHFRG
ncbi:MAG: PTS fructose transporter subunit IIA [Gammaproteobacteria bacterium]|nr:PTS fructose transporter subunit IIA [Gammaproteobacteria bacterium]